MSSLTSKKSPPPTIAPAADTPATRVEWHLACFKARALGNPPPPAPWETPREAETTRYQRPTEPLHALRAPMRGTRSTSKNREAQNKPPSQLKTARSAPQKKAPPPSAQAPHAIKPLAVNEPSFANAFSAATLPPRPSQRDSAPHPREVRVALVQEKLPLVSSLLLRAGVPPKLIALDNRAQAVIDNFESYLRAPIAQTLHRYEFGRQFVTRGDVGIANRAANIVLPMLLANTHRELLLRFSQAEADIQREILSVNLPKR